MIRGLYEAHLPVSDIKRSVAFYEGLGLDLAFSSPTVAFLWIERGRSWLGLWVSDHAAAPYHPSIRHVAFRVELQDIKRAQDWLRARRITPRTDSGVAGEHQPLVLENGQNYHAAIYFDDPDGNSLELISPLAIDAKEEPFNGTTLAEWLNAH